MLKRVVRGRKQGVSALRASPASWLAAGVVVTLTIGTLAAAPPPPAREAARPLHAEGARSDPGEAKPPGPTYELIPVGAGMWSGTNGTHQLRLSFSADGVRLAPLDEKAGTWEAAIALSRVGNGEGWSGAGEGWPEAVESVFRLLRGSIAETFVNSRKGLVHELEIGASEEPGRVSLDFTVAGSITPKVAEGGQTIEFKNRWGAAVLAYRDLRARDADGREVDARWERVETPSGGRGALRLVIEGAEHAHPLAVSGRLVTPKGESGPGAGLTRAGSLAAAGSEITATGGDGTVASGADLLATLLPPTNDLCSGAEVIPGEGPFPYLSGAYDITAATTTGDPPVPSCQPNVSRSLWFEYTPATTGSYTFSLCADAPTATTLDDTVLAVYAASGDCAALEELALGCDDDGCAAGDLQSVIGNLDLSAGTTYYIVAWQYGVTVPLGGASAVQLQVVLEPPAGPAPPNDRCSGAEVISGAGPFPYLTAVTPDISGATGTGDPPLPSCQPDVSRSIWFSFMPEESGRYTFSLCADAPTGTTVDDTVMAIYSVAGVCDGLAQVAGGCDDDSCLSESAQSVTRDVELSANTPYAIVVWQYGLSRPAAGQTAIQMRVSRELAPANDLCGTAPELRLRVPVSGTTANARDDYQLPADTACFTGIGQTASTVSGGDVAYRFSAPSAGAYSFRATGYEAARNLVLYVAADCPSGTSLSLIEGCLGGANRNPGYPAEEVMCLDLSAGQEVYVYVDEAASLPGSAFVLEVSECSEETEPNDGPEDSGGGALPGGLPCGSEGSVAPPADVDLFALGTAEAGSRLFAIVDGAAANSTDFDLRVVTLTDTLEYDDLNDDTPFGSVAPNVGGTRLGGDVAYLRVSHYDPSVQAQPYRLYAAVQPPAGSAAPEVEPDDTLATATWSAGAYYAGALDSAGDVDLFAFEALAGELLHIGLDLDPRRDNTPFNGALALLDAAGMTLLPVSDAGSSSSTASGAGSLGATTPGSPAEAIAYRARASGTYYARVSWTSGTPGDYLLSVARDCRIGPPTDLALSQTDAPDPVPAAGEVRYAVEVRNLGSHAASLVVLNAELPAGAVLLSFTPSQGFCSGSGSLICHLGSIASGGMAGVQVEVMAPVQAGTMTHTARLTSAVLDLNPANDVSTETTTVGPPPDADGDGAPDTADCAPLDPQVWAAPGSATGLSFPDPANRTLLRWDAPASPGGLLVRYDLLRGVAAGDFSAPTCVARDVAGTSAIDPALPAKLFLYLVRAKNACGANLGASSYGSPRAAGSCP